MRRALAFSIALSSATLFGPSLAYAQQGPDSATRATARKLAIEGNKLFDQGDFAGALEKFNVADSLVPAPTLGLRAARCLVRLGRYVEASERYLEVTRMQLDRFANPTLRKAQADAVAEREKLLPRIPQLEIMLEGPRGDGVQISVDEKPLPTGIVGQKQPVDPGTHKVRAKRADTEVSTDVTLAEGAAESVVLKLPALPIPAPPPPPKSDGKTQRFIGWASLGLGAGAFVLFAANGFAALATQSTLEGECPDRQCGPSAHGTANLYDTERTISSIGFFVGLAAVGAAVPLLLTAPKKQAAVTIAPVAFVAPRASYAGIAVRF